VLPRASRLQLSLLKQLKTQSSTNFPPNNLNQQLKNNPIQHHKHFNLLPIRGKSQGEFFFVFQFTFETFFIFIYFPFVLQLIFSEPPFYISSTILFRRNFMTPGRTGKNCLQFFSLLFLCLAFHKVEFVELEKKIKAEMSLKQWKKVFSSIRRSFLSKIFLCFLRKKKREQKKYDDESRRLAEKMLQREVYISFQFPPNRRLFIDSARFWVEESFLDEKGNYLLWSKTH
jgi:hypothetical protein